MPMAGTILAIFKEPSEDDSTNKRLTCYLYLVFSFPNLLYYCCPVKRRQALLRSNLPRNNCDRRSSSRPCLALTFQGRFLASPRMMIVAYALKNLLRRPKVAPFRCGSRRIITKLIRFVPTENVPNNRCKPSHHSNSCRLRTSSVFDFLVPRLHRRVFAHSVDHRKVQNISCYHIAAFCNAANTMLTCRVMTTRCQAKVIRKAVGILKTMNIANTRKQGDRSHCTDAGNRFET